MFDKLKIKYRKHNYDLENPEYAEIDLVYPYTKIPQNASHKISIFKCKNCEKQLWLELWQMKQLPFEMARGCPGMKG